jgi:uncharacterized OB-fold protein
VEFGRDLSMASPAYVDGLAEGLLVLPFCPQCQVWSPPWISRCRRDDGHVIEWCPVTGRGLLEGWITYRKPYPLPRNLPVPYSIGHVKLDCGVRLNGELEPSGITLRQGLPVVFAVKPEAGRYYPAFKPSSLLPS